MSECAVVEQKATPSNRAISYFGNVFLFFVIA